MKYESFIPEWKKLYEEEHCSFREIGKRYDVDAKTVNRTLDGVVKKRPKSKWMASGEEWLSLYKRGWSKTDIAKKYGTYTSQVTKILSFYGISPEERKDKRLYSNLLPQFIKMYEDGHSLSEIAAVTNVDKQTVANYLEREGVDRRGLSESIRRHSYNETYFDDIDTKEKAYHLGLLYSEGSLLDQHNNYAIRFDTSSKTSYLIKPLIDVLGLNEEMVYTANDDVCRIRIHSKHLYERLKGLGLDFRKDSRFPFLEETFYAAFLYGYFEGRLIRTVKKKCLYIGGNLSFLIRVVHILEHYAGIPKEVWKMERNADYSRIHLYRKGEIAKLFIWLKKEAGAENFISKVKRPPETRSPFVFSDIK